MISKFFLSALGALALVQPALAQDAAFRDDFDTFDQGRWYASDGWSNGSHQNCTWSADQAKAASGNLQLGFAPIPKGDRQYRCGEIQTRLAYGYGTFETRMKTPAGSGLNAAFFSYIGAQQKKPHDEIDFEVLLRDTGHVDTTTFVNGVSGDGEIGAGQSHALPRPSDSDFITYAFTWAPDKVSYYIDGDVGYILNPVVVELSGEPELVDEGCLSVPGLWYPTKRYPFARVTGINLDGEAIEVSGFGLMAQALQHETDHLDGLLYLDRLDKENRRAAMKEVRESDWF